MAASSSRDRWREAIQGTEKEDKAYVKRLSRDRTRDFWIRIGLGHIPDNSNDLNMPCFAMRADARGALAARGFRSRCAPPKADKMQIDPSSFRFKICVDFPQSESPRKVKPTRNEQISRPGRGSRQCHERRQSSDMKRGR
jgi:hypothetical protein